MQFEQLLQPLSEFIQSLNTQKGEKVEIINQVRNKEHILLSIMDLSDSRIPKNNPIPVELYIRSVLISKAEDEIKSQDSEDDMLIKRFEEFEAHIINHLNCIKHIIAEISCKIAERKASNFIKNFSNGMLMDKNIFINSFQDAIIYASTSTQLKKNRTKRISKILKKFLPSLKNVEEALQLEKNIVEISDCIIPKSIELIDQITVNQEISIPHSNGIDIHPTKNKFIAMGCNNGDLIIRDQDINQEICRLTPGNNFGGSVQNCLWNPSGDKIMVSTHQNHSIYIYDETGQKLLKAIERTYSKYGWGAIWLSEKEVAVGYYDETVKFFNIDEEKEIGSVKISGICAWGMDCLNDSHLLVGNKIGSISNIDWKNTQIEWVKTGWHLKSIRALRINQYKTKLLTCGEDCFVRLMALQDQSKFWESKLNDIVTGISWIPGELYALALSISNQLVVLNAYDGTKVIEFKKLANNLRSLRLNPRTVEIFIGDIKGTIRRLKICQ